MVSARPFAVVLCRIQEGKNWIPLSKFSNQNVPHSNVSSVHFIDEMTSSLYLSCSQIQQRPNMAWLGGFKEIWNSLRSSAPSPRPIRSDTLVMNYRFRAAESHLTVLTRASNTTSIISFFHFPTSAAFFFSMSSAELHTRGLKSPIAHGHRVSAD